MRWVWPQGKLPGSCTASCLQPWQNVMPYELPIRVTARLPDFFRMPAAGSS